MTAASFEIAVVTDIEPLEDGESPAVIRCLERLHTSMTCEPVDGKILYRLDDVRDQWPLIVDYLLAIGLESEPTLLACAYVFFTDEKFFGDALPPFFALEWNHAFEKIKTSSAVTVDGVDRMNSFKLIRLGNSVTISHRGEEIQVSQSLFLEQASRAQRSFAQAKRGFTELLRLKLGKEASAELLTTLFEGRATP